MWRPPFPRNMQRSPLIRRQTSTFLVWWGEEFQFGVSLHITSLNTSVFLYRKVISRAFLVVQWLRNHLSMQGTQVQSLVREDAISHRENKPMDHNYWACVLGAGGPQLLSPRTTPTEAYRPRARAAQEEPLQWEARTAMKSNPCSPQIEKAHMQQWRQAQPKINKVFKKRKASNRKSKCTML